jgi:hypothetical protein
MRKMPAGFLWARRIRPGLALGGALAAGIAVLAWNQGCVEDDATAFLLDSIPQPDSLRLETASGPTDPAARHEDSATAQPAYEARFSREYFEPGYYAAASPGRVSTPAASTAAPWLGDLDDLHKMVLLVASTPAIDFSRADKVSVAPAGSVAALAPPPGIASRQPRTVPPVRDLGEHIADLRDGIDRASPGLLGRARCRHSQRVLGRRNGRLAAAKTLKPSETGWRR